MQLADLLTEWTTVAQGRTMFRQRGSENDGPGTEDFWRGQVRAVSLLEEVGRQLDALAAANRRVGGWQRAYPEWARAVFAPEVRWGEGQSYRLETMAEPHLDSLRSFGEYLDMLEVGSAVITPQAINSSAGALDEVIGLLGRLDLPVHQRQYAFALLDRVRTMMSAVGADVPLDLLRQVNELVGFLNLLASELQGSDEEEARTVGAKLRDAAFRAAPWLVLGGKIGLAALDGGANVHELTTGE